MADTIKIKPYKMPTIKITRLSNGDPVILENINKTLDANGDYIFEPTPPYNALRKVAVHVSVDRSKMQEKSVSIFKKTTITPDQGYVGLGKVVVTPITEEKTSYVSAIIISGRTYKSTGRTEVRAGTIYYEWKAEDIYFTVYTIKQNPVYFDWAFDNTFYPRWNIGGVIGKNIPAITQSGRYTFEPSEGKLLSKVSVDVDVTNFIPIYSATRKLADNDRDLLIGIPDYIDNLSPYSLRLFRKRFVKNKRTRGQEALYPRYALNHWHEVWNGRPYIDSNRVFTPEIGNLVFKKDGISYYRVIFRAIGDSNPDNLPANGFINSYITPFSHPDGEGRVLCKELMVHGTWGLCLVRQSLIQSEFAVFKVNPANSLVTIGV